MTCRTISMQYPHEKALLAKIATTPPRKLNTRQEDAIKKPSVRLVNSRE